MTWVRDQCTMCIAHELALVLYQDQKHSPFFDLEMLQRTRAKNFRFFIIKITIYRKCYYKNLKNFERVLWSISTSKKGNISYANRNFNQRGPSWPNFLPRRTLCAEKNLWIDYTSPHTAIILFFWGVTEHLFLYLSLKTAVTARISMCPCVLTIRTH